MYEPQILRMFSHPIVVFPSLFIAGMIVFLLYTAIKGPWSEIGGAWVREKELKHSSCFNTTKFRVFTCFETGRKMGFECLVCGKKLYFSKSTLKDVNPGPLVGARVKLREKR